MDEEVLKILSMLVEDLVLCGCFASALLDIRDPLGFIDGDVVRALINEKLRIITEVKNVLCLSLLILEIVGIRSLMNVQAEMMRLTT